jgi:hypothetical protein
MAYYRGRIGADLTKPAFGVEDVWDPVANNGSPYFVLEKAFGWDPYRLPTYDLQEIISDYGITNETYTQTYPVDYVTTNDDFTGQDISFGATDPSWYSLTPAPNGYTYDTTTPITFTVTSPYELQNPTETTSRAASTERTWNIISNSHTVTTIELVNPPSNAVTSAAIGGDTRIIQDRTLAYKETRYATVICLGSSTGFTINESSVNNYGSGHDADEYGSFLFENFDVSARCSDIRVTVTSAITGGTMNYTLIKPSPRSVDGGYVWNSAEQAIHGGSNVITVRTPSGLPFSSGTRIDFEFDIQTFDDRNANNDITHLYDITYVKGTTTANPEVRLSKKANPGRNQGAPKGCQIDGTVVWPYSVYTFNNNLSGHNAKALTNISGYSWITDTHEYLSYQYPVKTINVVVRQSNGNVSPMGYSITRPAVGPGGYYNGLSTPSSNVSSAVQINFTSGQLEPGMTVDLEVTYDKLANTNAGIDWSTYYNAAINDVDTASPKLRVYGNGSNPVAPSFSGVPHGMTINCNFYSTTDNVASGHGVTTLAANTALHDPINFGYSLGNTLPTYGCYEITTVVRNGSGQNKTSLTTTQLPPLDVYGYYDASQGVIVTMNDGSGLPYDWEVQVTEKYNTYRDLGLNLDITSDYTFTEEYIDSNNPALGVFVVVTRNGGVTGPPNNTYMRTRYFWDLDPGGLPIVVLLNQNFYR